MMTLSEIAEWAAAAVCAIVFLAGIAAIVVLLAEFVG